MGYWENEKVGYFRLWQDVGDVSELPLGCLMQVTMAKFDRFGFTALPPDDPAAREIHTHVADDIDMSPFLHWITVVFVQMEEMLLESKRKT